MMHLFFIALAIFTLSCTPQDSPLSSAAKIAADPQVAVAGDSLYCRDAAFWRGYCRHWGALPKQGCEAIATCAEGDTAGVAVIESDTAWVEFNPSHHGWLRVPQEFPSISRQRWTHPHYALWASDTLSYQPPALPEDVGLVIYPFRGKGFKRILYGFRTPTYAGSFPLTPQEEPDLPEVTIQEEGIRFQGDLPAGLFNMVVGQSINFTLPAATGEEPIFYAFRYPLPGTSFDAETRQLSGTVLWRAKGTHEITYFASDANGASVEAAFEVTVIEVPPSVTLTYSVGEWFIHYLPNPPGTDTYGWSGDGLPPGIDFSWRYEQGTFQGAAQEVGTFDVRYWVYNEREETIFTDVIRFVITPGEPLDLIAAPEPLEVLYHEIETTFTVGSDVSLELWAATGGMPPYQYILSGQLPDGLSFDVATRTILGRPTTTGRYDLEYLIVDQYPSSLAVPFSISIEEAQ